MQQPTHTQHTHTQHNTTQHNTTQHNTTQHNTTQHKHTHTLWRHVIMNHFKAVALLFFVYFYNATQNKRLFIHRRGAISTPPAGTMAAGGGQRSLFVQLPATLSVRRRRRRGPGQPARSMQHVLFIYLFIFNAVKFTFTEQKKKANAPVSHPRSGKASELIHPFFKVLFLAFFSPFFKSDIRLFQRRVPPRGPRARVKRREGLI